jgi:hypothetical protein
MMRKVMRGFVSSKYAATRAFALIGVTAGAVFPELSSIAAVFITQFRVQALACACGLQPEG